MDHQPLLAKVEQELLGSNPVFPTSLKLAVHIRQALEKPNSTLVEIAQLVEAEPLIAAKLVRLANSVTFNPYGREVVGISQIVARVGLNAVRSASISIAVDQIKLAPSMARYQSYAERIWRQTVLTAAYARTLAKTTPGVSDAALLCALVSNLGVFYLLFRAGSLPSYANPDDMKDLLARHHAQVGTQLLKALGMPENIVLANSAQPLDSAHPAHSLRALLTEARRLAKLAVPPPADEPRLEWLQSVQGEVASLSESLLVC